MKITTMEEILSQAPTGPEPLTLPGWRPGSEITVMVRRPGLYRLLAENAVLNPLIPEMNKLFIRHDYAGAKQPTNDYAKALIAIAKACLQDPTWEELEAADVRLTDEQLLRLALYATEGPEFLCSFRAANGAGAGRDGAAVPDAAEPAFADR